MSLVEEDLAAQLRRQIAQATSEKESAKIELEALKRTIDSHLLRLNGVLNAGDVSYDRLSGTIQAFDSDLRGRLDGDATALLERPGNSEGTYEVLRHSLNDAQRRCQVLNGDMLRVADANEELMSTLKTLKGTNKRLVEEVQKQTEELSNLTQQRLLDTENLARLEEAFKQEQALWQQEAARCIEDEQARCNQDFTKMRDQLTSQLDECWHQAKTIAGKASQVRTQQVQLKAEVQGFSGTVTMNLKKLERELLERISSTSRRLQNEQSKLRDVEHNLQVKLRAEKEVRENETEAWRARHKTLASELEDLIARRDREVSDLQVKIEGTNSTREAEAAAFRKDRAAMHDKTEVLVKDVALLEAMMQTARRKSLQLEAHLAQAEGERDRLQATAETLRHQIRESDEALGEAVRSNEALREQMEVQRLESQNASERDLKTCREMFEKRLEVTAHGYAAEQQDLAKRIKMYEESLGLKAGELQAVRESLAEKTRQRDALQRDVQMWKAQHELAAKMKADVDRDFSQFRQDSLGGELRRLQEQHDELTTKKAELEMHRNAVIEEAQDVQQAVKAREVANAERAKAIADQEMSTSAEIQRTKSSLLEAERSLASAKAEAAAVAQQMNERRDSLEQDLARLIADQEVDKREFERKIQAERQNCDGLRESFEKLRNEHSSSYKAAFEGPVQQISALEGAISEIQRSSDAELSGFRQKSEKLRVRVEELEGELARVQAKLASTEQEVQEGTSRVNVAKSNHRAAKEALEREKALKSEEAQQVQRSIVQKTEQLKASTRQSEDQRRRMLRDIEESKQAKSRQLADADSRLQALRTEYSMAIEDKEHTPPTVTLNVRDRIDGLARENEDLRRYVGQHKHAASHIQDVGSQMQRTLSSMEGRAAELRRELRR
jgi:chromosome segregation ATPase